MKTRYFLYITMFACCITACNDGNEFADAEKKVATDGKSLKVEVVDEFAEATTRADYSGFPATTFEEGDAIGVYAVNTSNVAVSQNVAFTRNADGSWTPAASVVYNPDYKYYAYFPYKSSGVPSFLPAGSGADGKFANFLNSNTFWLADQSTKENFTTSNLMWAEGIITGDKTVRFSLAHKRGLAVINPSGSKWYYTDNPSTKYDLEPIFSGNIPYEIVSGGGYYFLMKPNTDTSVGGLTLRAGAGKYMVSSALQIMGEPSYVYRQIHYGQSSEFSTSQPSWLTITPNVVDGEPTEFAITVTNSTSTTYSKGTGTARDVPGDAVLKAASPVSNVDLSMVDNAGNARASRTTANCYLVHAPGTYKIPLVYGNAIKNGDDTSTAAFYTTQTSNTLQRLVNHANAGITSPWIKTQLGECPDGAQLVWEDVQGMISSVGIDTSDNGYLTFTVDADNIAEGNAVIAATLDGTIVWSWHVWVTPQTLSSLTTVDTGSHTYQVAPVNVGYVNGTIKAGATIYAGDLCTVTCTSNGVSMEFTVTAKDYTSGGTTYYNPSPYYQWGRKDAMYPCTGGFNSAGTLISTYSGTTLVTATSATPGATIQHPDYWYYNSSNRGPYGTNSTYAGKYNYWDMNNTSIGIITTATVKTIYDPCPPDFCVPTVGLWSYAKTNSANTAWQSTPPGRNWTVNGRTIFFPAAGYRGSSNSSFGNVGYIGNCWSTSPDYTNYGRYLAFSSSVWTLDSNDRTRGCSVRAVAEE